MRFTIGFSLRFLMKRKIILILIVLCIAIIFYTFVITISKNKVPDTDFKSVATVTSKVSRNHDKTTILLSERNKIVKSVESLDAFLLKTYSNYNESKPKSKLLYPNYFINGTQIVINKHTCSDQFGDDLLLVIFVFNRVDGFERRKTIRNTWANDTKTNPKSRIYFAVAMTSNQTVQKMLEEESRLYSDIIQINYIEFYFNCTLKALGLLRWTSLYCPFVKWILKVDDDTVLISNDMVKFADTTKADAIYGILYTEATPVRDDNNRWVLTKEDYPNDTFPHYIPGAYLIPGQSCLHLYETALTLTLPALPYEDVYLTGVVAEKANIPRKEYHHFVWFPKRRHQLKSCWLENATLYIDWLTDNDINRLWLIYQNKTYCTKLI